MPFIYDLIDPQELVGFVRELEFPEFSLDRFLPNRNIEGLEYRFTKSDRNDEDAATYRSFDAEAPIGKREGLTRVRGEIPPLSKKIRLGEEERLRTRALETGDEGELIDAIYDDAARMTRSVQARIERARGQALYDGKVVINENGVGVTADFGMPAGNRVTAALAWSDPTADLITELLGWMEDYVDLNGVEPGRLLLSTKALGWFLSNDQVRTYAGMGNVAGTPATVNREQLASVLNAYGLPPIETYDTKVRVNGTATRVIPEDRALFLPGDNEPLGNTFYGLTAEALVLRGDGQIVSQDAPGVVAVIENTFDPVATWTKAAAIALPVVANPELIFTIDTTP